MMKIDSLLNGGHIPTIPNSTAVNTQIMNSSSPSDPALSLQPYTMYPRSTNFSREPTVSSRSSYSGPSFNPSTARTSPSEVSIPQLSVLGEKPLFIGLPQELVDVPSTSYMLRDPRALPPLTSFVNNISPTLPTPSEGALSPHSTPHHHQHNHHHHHQQHAPELGYFPPTHPRVGPFNQNQALPQYQPLRVPQNQQNPPGCTGSGNNALLSFAKVAMETATMRGRRNLEMEAAAEVLTGHEGSVSLLPRNPFGGRYFQEANAGQDVVNVSALNIPFFRELDPMLRPASAGSVASTGRTIEDNEESDPTPTQKYSAATQTTGSPPDSESPLYRLSPDPSTPRPTLAVDTAIAGPSASNGPLNIPSPSPQEFLTQPPKCSYCSVCTTGSPLRKVVSHIFGRNKLSTRQIPKNVWVYYCRKHYQRSRYRNPRGFARQQVLLVKRQCERLQLWGGVKDWVIKVRRREEIRMTREGGGDNDEVDEIEDDNDDAAAGATDVESQGPASGESSRRNSNAAVAHRRSSTSGGLNWIMKHTGSEKSITDVYKLLDKIEVEVQDNGGKFPDVELLPNVILAMAVPMDGPDDDGNGGDDEDLDGDTGDGPGVAGPNSTKKRRRADSGSGSSGGDDSRGKKRTRATGTDTKKSDRKAKDDVSPTYKVVWTQELSDGELKRLGRGEILDGDLGNISSSGNVGLQLVDAYEDRQVVTPPPSTVFGSPSRHVSPEFEAPRPVDGLRITETLASAQKYWFGSLRRSSRNHSSSITTQIAPKQRSRRNSVNLATASSPPTKHSLDLNLTPKELAAIAGEPLHRFDLRGNEDDISGEMIMARGKKVPKKRTNSVGGKRNKTADENELLDCITVANS